MVESAWERAKISAGEIYRSAPFAISLAIAELLAVPLAVLFTFDSDEIAVQIAVPLLTGASAMALALLAVIGFQILAAPIRQRNELRAHWQTREKASATRIQLKLKNLRRQGEDLLQNISPAGYSEEDRTAVEDWTEETIAFLTENCEAKLVTGFIEASSGSRFVPALEQRISSLEELAKSLD